MAMAWTRMVILVPAFSFWSGFGGSWKGLWFLGQRTLLVKMTCICKAGPE